jgi:hypothetical protein
MEVVTSYHMTLSSPSCTLWNTFYRLDACSSGDRCRDRRVFTSGVWLWCRYGGTHGTGFESGVVMQLYRLFEHPAEQGFYLLAYTLNTVEVRVFKILSNDVRGRCEFGPSQNRLDVNDVEWGQSERPQNAWVIDAADRIDCIAKLTTATPTTTTLARRQHEHQLRPSTPLLHSRCSHDTHPPRRPSAQPPTEPCPRLLRPLACQRPPRLRGHKRGPWRQ